MPLQTSDSRRHPPTGFIVAEVSPIVHEKSKHKFVIDYHTPIGVANVTRLKTVTRKVIKVHVSNGSCTQG